MKNIRRDGRRTAAKAPQSPSKGALASAMRKHEDREYLLGFDPAFDGRDDGVTASVTLPGSLMRFVDSEHAGRYWEAFLPVHGGQVQVIIRDLGKKFQPERRNTFCGLLRITRKTNLKGKTVIVTIKDDPKLSDEDLTHELKIFQQAPTELPPQHLLVEPARGGMVVVLERQREAQAAAA